MASGYKSTWKAAVRSDGEKVFGNPGKHIGRMKAPAPVAAGCIELSSPIHRRNIPAIAPGYCACWGLLIVVIHNRCAHLALLFAVRLPFSIVLYRLPNHVSPLDKSQLIYARWKASSTSRKNTSNGSPWWYISTAHIGVNIIWWNG